MKLKALILALALGFTGAAVAHAQDPQMGTWKLNEAKSKIPAGVQKNSTVIYETQGDSVKVTTDGTGADGSAVHTEWTGKFDGKEYPLTGDPTADARSYTKVNDHTLKISNTKAGKVVMGGSIVVSADGKTRTLSISGANAAGKKVSETAMYDKQ
jgi:hypothetical protein